MEKIILVSLITTLGPIEIKLFTEEAPETTKNFIEYVESGFFDETIFHRVIPGFVIQGGGHTSGMNRKDTLAPIQNEANKIADNDQPNREVHLTNGKNACNMLKQYVAISIHTQPKEFPSSRSLCFHMSKHISYVNNQSHSHDCVTHMVENNIAMSNMNDSGYEVVLFLWKRCFKSYFF